MKLVAQVQKAMMKNIIAKIHLNVYVLYCRNFPSVTFIKLLKL